MVGLPGKTCVACVLIQWNFDHSNCNGSNTMDVPNPFVVPSTLIARTSLQPKLFSVPWEFWAIEIRLYTQNVPFFYIKIFKVLSNRKLTCGRFHTLLNIRVLHTDDLCQVSGSLPVWFLRKMWQKKYYFVTIFSTKIYSKFYQTGSDAGDTI